MPRPLKTKWTPVKNVVAVDSFGNLPNMSAGELVIRLPGAAGDLPARVDEGVPGNRLIGGLVDLERQALDFSIKVQYAIILSHTFEITPIHRNHIYKGLEKI